MEGVLVPPVFLSFEKFRWQKSIRNVALHTDAHASRYHPNLYSISPLIFSSVTTFLCEMETVFTSIQLTGN